MKPENKIQIVNSDFFATQYEGNDSYVIEMVGYEGVIGTYKDDSLSLSANRLSSEQLSDITDLIRKCKSSLNKRKK